MIISLWGARDRPSSESARLPPMWGVSWCCGNYCLLAFVLWCGYCSVSFQSFVLRHWCPQHQETTPMWPGLKSRHRAICGLSLLLVLSLAPRGFSPGTLPGFPLCGCTTSKSLFIYFFRDRTLQSAGLNADFNFIFSKSAGACNVSFCFDFYLNVILRVLFSVALNH